MAPMNTTSVLLLLVAVAITVGACVVIFRLRQVQSTRGEARREAAGGGKHRSEVEQEAGWKTEEVERKTEAQCQTGELRKAEEERHRAEDEQRRRKADGGQRKANEVQIGEGEYRRSEEEEGKRLEEVTPRKEGEAQRKREEEKRLKADAESERLERGKGGGRSRGPVDGYERQPGQETASRRPKPEVVCWKRERQWIPAVEVPEELLGKPGLTVLQDGSPLSQDESREACWRLEQAFGEAAVRWNEHEDAKETKVVLGQEGYLLFKLSGQDQNHGRCVKSPSSGSYLVMAPANWDRNGELSGPPPVAPEPVSLAGHQAHFFVLDRDGSGKMAFRGPAGEPFVIESKASRFEVVGNQLDDASEGVGPLFGEGPPKMRALDDQTWKDVGTIVVGREGRGRRKWRLQFDPVREGMQPQGLPLEVAKRKGGWYFLRFYDTDGDLIESLDFRFLSALREIRISQSSPLPPGGGHKPVCVEFLHESGCIMQPTDDPARCIQIESKDNKTTLTIPPEFGYDETRWRVGSEGTTQVQVTILVERLWWAVGSESKPPPEWGDNLLTLASDDLAATSEKALWLRLPKRRWADRVSVGFEPSEARPYVVKVTEKEIAVPLRDFGDCREVSERDRDHCLKIRIKRDSERIEGIVAIIPASQQPILCVERGRKKTAIATAVLREGTGAIKVNGQPVADYFKKAPLKARQFLRRLLELPYVSRVLSQMEVSIEVRGSSPSTVQQAKASAHALARTLMKYDSRLKPLLKQEGFGGARATKRSGMQ